VIGATPEKAKKKKAKVLTKLFLIVIKYIAISIVGKDTILCF
jgi:hypothetical protein